MAKIIGSMAQGIVGSIDDYSIYKMRGVKEPVLRKKGGHPKERVKNDPDLRRFRQAGSEFGGRALASKYIMQALTFQKPLADYNIAGPLGALMYPVQQLDTVSDLGQRNIMLSAHPHFLKGFSLNRNHHFDSVVRYPVAGILERETASATISIPELLPQVNLVCPVNHPYYSFVATLGVVPNILYNGNAYTTTHIAYLSMQPKYIMSDWYPLLEGSPAIHLNLQYKGAMPDDQFTFVLAIGIRYGLLKGANKIQQAPYVGSAKVLEVG